MIRAAIRFVEPASLGFADPSLDDPEQATIVCARTGLGDLPIDVGYLAHHVRRTAGGSEMRSRFWIGGPYAAGRNSALGTVMAQAARLLMRPSETDARAALVHCAEELAYAEFGAGLERGDFSSNRHVALAICLRMIFPENRVPLFGIML